MLLPRKRAPFYFCLLLAFTMSAYFIVYGEIQFLSDL